MEKKYDNSGVLFKEADKKTPTHPDYKGNILVDGKDYWLSAWIKEGKNGVKFMGLAVSPRDENYKAKSESSKKQDLDEDIPF
jgi:hypothetical protein